MSKFAWVTLTTNDTYSLGALVLAHSLRRTGTAHQLAVMVTPGVSESMRTKLKDVYNVVQEVNVMDSQDAANLALLARPELGITFTKLHCWRLVQFEKCVFLDADTLVLQNSDELFEREELSAAPDVSWPDCFNSGVFVYRPSLDTFDKITEFALKNGSFDGGDQGLLNSYFADWAHTDITKHLPFIYNVTAYASYCYLPAFKQFRDKIKILHFAGKMKPWLIQFNSANKTACTPTDYAHAADVIQLWWNIFCENVHQKLSDNMSYLAVLTQFQWNAHERNNSAHCHEDSHESSSHHSHHHHHHSHHQQHMHAHHHPSHHSDDFANVKDFRDPWEDYYANLEREMQAQEQQQQQQEQQQQQQQQQADANARRREEEEEEEQRMINAIEQQQHHQQPPPAQRQSSEQPEQPMGIGHATAAGSDQPAVALAERQNDNDNDNDNDNAMPPEAVRGENETNLAISARSGIAPNAGDKLPTNYEGIHSNTTNTTTTKTTKTTTTTQLPLPSEQRSNNAIATAGARHSTATATTTTTTTTTDTNRSTPSCVQDPIHEAAHDDTVQEDEAGLAGALAQVRLGEPRTPEQEAYEQLMRRQCWESGQIDYAGKDSFENIWKKITQTMDNKPAASSAPQRDDKSELMTSADIEDGKVEFDPVTNATTKYKLIEGGYEMITTTPQQNGTIKTQVRTFWDPKPVSDSDLVKEAANKKLVKTRMGKEIRIDKNTTMLTREIDGGYEEVYTTVHEDGSRSMRTKTFYDSVPQEMGDNTTSTVDQSKNKTKKTITRKSSVDSTDSTESRKIVQKKNVVQNINDQQSKYQEHSTVEETRRVTQNIEITENNRTVRKNSLQEQSIKAVTQTSNTSDNKDSKKKKKTKSSIPPPPPDFLENDTTTVASKRVPGGVEYTYSTQLDSGKTITTTKTVYEEEEVEMTEEEISQYKKTLKDAEKHKNVTTTKKLRSESGTKKVVPSENPGDVTTVETIKIEGGTEYHYTTVTAEGIVKKAVKTIYDPVPSKDADDESEEEIVEEYEEEIIEPGEKNIRTIETVKQLPKQFQEEVTITHEKKEKKIKKSMMISH